jgi:disulfide bond formation protein DsbB
MISAAVVAACAEPGPSSSAADPAAGKRAFVATCATCHGPEGRGINGLGKDLRTSGFVRGQSDEQLLAFLMAGRPSSDPLNTTGVDMPPRGGNPALSDGDLKNIVAYLRTIQE